MDRILPASDAFSHRAMFETSDAAIWVVDADDRLIYANRAYEAWFGPRVEETGDAPEDAPGGEETATATVSAIAETVAENNARVRRERRAIAFEEAVPVEGALRSFTTIRFPLYDAQGRVHGVCAVGTATRAVRDARHTGDEPARSTRTLEAEVAERTGELVATRARLELAFEAARLGTWEWERDAQGRERIFWDAQMLALHGLEAAPESFAAFLEMIHPQDARTILDSFDVRDATYAFHYRYRHPDGEWRTFEWRGARSSRGEDGNGSERDSDGESDRGTTIVVRGVAVDVSEEHALRAEVERLAYLDPVTGLPNRQLFEDRTEQAIRQARADDEALALLLIDLDEFKLVNEALGHAAGDRLLQLLAQRLADCVSERDTVARLGGDEFAVLLTRLDDPRAAVWMADRIHAALTRPFRIAERDLLVNASIGISIVPDDADALSDLLRHADAAMYEAKSSSSVRTVVHSGDTADANLARLTLRSAIRRGIDEGEFGLVYQPRVDLMTRGIASVEALARWNAPDLGAVSPGEFIPAAERSGLIVPLGRELLRQVARRWRRHIDGGGKPLTVAVNVSPRQLVVPGFSEEVARILEEARMPPRYLEIELTESVVLDAVRAGGDAIERLHRLGVTLSIDDFGTGLSSLRYLEQLPVHALKIDRSFVAGLDTRRTDGRGNAIPVAVIAMARSFGLDVIAEGVETPQQARMLVQLGCRCAQGFGLRRPAPWAEAVAPL